MTQAAELSDITARVWDEVGGPAGLLGSVAADGPRTVLPSHFDVTGLATASALVKWSRFVVISLATDLAAGIFCSC